MGHKILVDGTVYELTGGRGLVDGTGYNIKKGRTLIDGTGYDISFAPPPLIVYDGGDALVNGTMSESGVGESITNGAITIISSNGRYGYAKIENIDLAGYSTLNFIVRHINAKRSTMGYAEIDSPPATFISKTQVTSEADTQYTVDLSDFVQPENPYCIKLYLSLTLGQSSGSLYCTKIWLE